MITTLDICVWLWVIVAYLLFVLFLNWTYSYWSLSKYIIAPISNREPFIVKVISIMTLLAIFVDPIFILAEYGWIGDDTKLALQLFGVIGYPLRIIPMYLILYRLWMTYYNIKFQKAIDQNEWQSDINSNNSNQSISFFIKHRNSIIGHKRKNLYLIVFISVPLTALNIAFRWLYGSDAIRPLSTFVFCFPIPCIWILLCIIPSFDDRWNIRKEVKAASLYMSIIMLLILVIRTLFKSAPPELSYLGISILAIAMPISLQISLVYYPLKSYHLPTNILWTKSSIIKRYRDDHNQKAIEMAETDMFLQYGEEYEFEEKRDRGTMKLTLSKVLEDEAGFDLFARHLVLEFSIELLLFFVETQQFIIYMSTDEDVQNEYGNLNDHKQGQTTTGLLNAAAPKQIAQKEISEGSNSQITYSFKKLMTINLPNSAPKSVIVNKDNIADPRQQVRVLYDKYIIDNASIPLDIDASITEELSVDVLIIYILYILYLYLYYLYQTQLENI